MKRKSPTPMDEAKVIGSSFVSVSISDQPPAAAIIKTKREIARGVSPLTLSRLPSNELDRSSTSPIVRSPGLTTNRSGEIVQSGTLSRAATMNSLARNKSNDQLVEQASTLSSQSQRSTDNRQEVGTLSRQNQRSRPTDDRLEGRLLGPAADRDADASKKAATLDRSWRTKEADLTENLPKVGGTFSFDLERDAQVLLDFIKTIEENGADSRRLNTTPTFEGNDMTVTTGMTRQKSSPRGSLRFQGVTCDVLGFNEKHAQSENGTTENPGFNKTTILGQKPQPGLHEASFRLPTVDRPIPLQEFNKTPQIVASGSYKVDTTPGQSQVLTYGFNKVDQTSACSQKFATDAVEASVYSPSPKGLLNDTSLSYGVGKTSVQFDHRAEQLLRPAGSPVGHVGVSAQRGYASDSEDPLDWLEQQKEKLKMRRCREEPITSPQFDPMFLQELKFRQRILGRTPVHEKENVGYLISAGRAQNSKSSTQNPDLYYREYNRGTPTPDLNTAWSDLYSMTHNYGPRIGGRKETPTFDLNRGGQYTKGSKSRVDGSHSVILSRCVNEVPLSNCQSSSLTSCSLNPNRTTETKIEPVKGFYKRNGDVVVGTFLGPSDQQEVHETCIAKKISQQHRGYSPTRFDALVSAAVTVDCESSPTSSRSTDRSDSGYATTSTSSTADEFLLTRPGQNTSNSNAHECLRAQTNQPAGIDFNMVRPEIRYKVTTSKLNETLGPQSSPKTVKKQLEFAATIHEQPKFPVSHSQQFYATSQQRPTFMEPAVLLDDFPNAFNLSSSKTLEEKIEELLAFGAPLELKQKIEHQPPENQLSIHDQRRPFAEVHEPFVYANTVKGRPDISYQNPTNFVEEQKQLLRVTGTQVPTSMDNQVTYRQLMNDAVSADQPIRTAAAMRHPTGINNLDQRVNQQPMNCRDSPDQPIRTRTDIRLATEVQIFNQLRAETYQPNGKLVEPTHQINESQTRMFSQNLQQLPDFPAHKFFVQVSTPLNNQTFTNHVTRHEAVNQPRYMGRKSPANQQLAGEWNVNSNNGMSKYATVAHVEQMQTTGKPLKANGLPNHMGRSGQEFQTRKPTGSESRVGFQGSLVSPTETGPFQYQQQQFGATRMEKVSSGPLEAHQQSPIEVTQRRQFPSQNSDGVFESPPPAVPSMNQSASRPLGEEMSRTSSFSSSVTCQSSPSLSADRSSGGSSSYSRDGVDASPQYFMQCVTEAYKEWYKPDMAREDVVNFLKDKPPGSFIIRNSTSYAGAFALAVKVSEVPVQFQHATGDMLEELVRHFLIESKPSGIRLKGRSNEPVFASLPSFVYQHALTPLSLPHKLLLPTSTDTISIGSGTRSLSRSSTSQSTFKAHDEISSMLIYIGAVDMETLTGPEALEKAVSQVETQNASPVTTTVVHFMVSSQGIVLTDTKRKLFFRRHYPLNCISYCGTDRGERRWTHDVDGSRKNTERRIFGFVCRKRGSTSAGSQTFPVGNECHLFADYETGYLADSVVDLVNKILRENGYNMLK